MKKNLRWILTLATLFLSCSVPFYERAKITEGFSSGIGLGMGTEHWISGYTSHRDSLFLSGSQWFWLIIEEPSPLLGFQQLNSIGGVMDPKISKRLLGHTPLNLITGWFVPSVSLGFGIEMF